MSEHVLDVTKSDLRVINVWYL